MSTCTPYGVDVLKVGGFKVSALEIEAKLLEHPGKAMQVEHIRLTLVLKAHLVVNPVESTSPFKFLVLD